MSGTSQCGSHSRRRCCGMVKSAKILAPGTVPKLPRHLVMTHFVTDDPAFAELTGLSSVSLSHGPSLRCVEMDSTLHSPLLRDDSRSPCSPGARPCRSGCTGRSLSVQRPKVGMDLRSVSNRTTTGGADKTQARLALRRAIQLRSAQDTLEVGNWTPFEHTYTPGWLKARWCVLWPFQVRMELSVSYCVVSMCARLSLPIVGVIGRTTVLQVGWFVSRVRTAPLVALFSLDNWRGTPRTSSACSGCWDRLLVRPWCW